jgi:hypothetical protein
MACRLLYMPARNKTKQEESAMSSIKTKEPTKRTAKPVAIKLAGLCVNCENAAACCLMGNADQPTQFCEEFITTSMPQISSMPEIEPIESTEPSQGLCVNCASRESCAFIVPGRPILECNEYA